ncbi:MAG: EVE domain-containing protein [Pseudomonadota bacterium]
MAHWLLKTEPGDYSWERFVADGRTVWDGVRNFQAAANMRAMQVGDEAFFYRSMKDPAVVGIMRIVREAYPASDDPKEKFVLIEVEPVAPLPEPVSLAAVKAEASLQDLALVRQSRLSVMPISDAAWALILRMGGHAD